MKSGRIVAHEYLHISNMTIWKQTAQGLLLKFNKLLGCVLWMKNACIIYGSRRIFWTADNAGDNVGKTGLLWSSIQSTWKDIRASFQLITWRASVVALKACFAAMTWDGHDVARWNLCVGP